NLRNRVFLGLTLRSDIGERARRFIVFDQNDRNAGPVGELLKHLVPRLIAHLELDRFAGPVVLARRLGRVIVLGRRAARVVVLSPRAARVIALGGRAERVIALGGRAERV